LGLGGWSATMTTPHHGPEVIINYSPKLDLKITLVRARSYEAVSLPEHFFEVDCRLRHPTGSFAYSFSHLCFEMKSFTQFSEELQSLSQGLSREATLKNVGEMMVLSLKGDSRQLLLTLDVREYLPPSSWALNAVVEVEYDLFVNKLRGAIDEFIAEIRQVEPSPL
jgi:hypothetical protein